MKQHTDALHPLVIREVTPWVDGGTTDEATRNWIRAIRQGFHESEPSPEKIRFLAERLVSKKSTGTLVYDPSLGEDPEFGASFPIATFESFTGELNLSGSAGDGGGAVACDMITGVSVNPTHRRRGILRTVMHEHLREAAERTPVAALTVSEGAIYGRFGFAPTSVWDDLEIETAGAQIVGEPTGEIRYVPVERLKELAPEVSQAFHRRAFGAIYQRDCAVRGLTGEDHEGLAGEMGKRRALIHLDEHGAIDGCATYSHGGWEEAERPYTLEVFDLVGATPEAEREMWRHFVALDLVDRIKHRNRSAFTRLFFRNPRSVKVTGREDFVWWRLLDLPAVFARLPYLSDGQARFTVEDPVGIVSGAYELTVTDGTGRLERCEDDDAGVRLGVGPLTEVIAARASLEGLAAVGLCEGRPEDIRSLGALLRFSGSAQCLIGF